MLVCISTYSRMMCSILLGSRGKAGRGGITRRATYNASTDAASTFGLGGPFIGSTTAAADTSSLETTVDDSSISYRLIRQVESQSPKVTQQPLVVMDTAFNSSANYSSHAIAAAYESEKPVDTSKGPPIEPVEIAKSPSTEPVETTKSPSTEPVEIAKSPSIEPVEIAKSPSIQPTESSTRPSLQPIEPSVSDGSPSIEPIKSATNDQIALAKEPATENGNSSNPDPNHRVNCSSNEPNVEAADEGTAAASDRSTEQGAKKSVPSKTATSTSSHIKQLSLLTKLVVPKPSSGGVQPLHVSVGKATVYKPPSQPSTIATSTPIGAPANTAPSPPQPIVVAAVQPTAGPTDVAVTLQLSTESIAAVATVTRDDDSPPPKKLSVAERIKSLESNIQKKK